MAGATVTRRDLALLLAAMVALTVAVIFAVVVIDSDPPATTTQVQAEAQQVLDQVAAGQNTSNCRSAVNARFDAAFSLVALAELNGGQYPDGIPPGVLEQLPPVDQARRDLVEAAIDKRRLDEICPT